jgi:Large polyvalent protein associated domain 38
MAITAQLFDGTTLEFPDDTPRSVIDKTVERATEERQAKPDTGLTGSFSAGKERLKGDIAAVLGRTGIMDTDAAEAYKAHKERLAEKMFKPTTESWSEAPFMKFKETLGGSLPYTVAPLAAGAIAATLPVSAPLAAGIGAAGAGIASLGQFTGSNLSRQMQENPEMSLAQTNLGSAAAAAIPQAALDVVSLRMIPGIGKIFGAAGKEVTPAIAKQIAEQGIARTALAYGASGAKLSGIEGATEAGQQFFERLQAGLNIADEQARSEYFDNFLGGAVLGGALSVPGTMVERRQTISKGAEMEKEEQQKAIQERQKAQQEAALAEREQINKTKQILGVNETLALPAPATTYEVPIGVDPLINPLGNFRSTDLSPKEVAEVNRRRTEAGLPRIGRTFSIEDLSNVFTPEEAKDQAGVLNRLIASRTGYQAGQDFNSKTVEFGAQKRGIDTGTQGFKDFLKRTTGLDDLREMSPVQRLAVVQALQKVQPGEETQILQSGISNAKTFTEDQYNDVVNGLTKEFKEVGNVANGRESVLKHIEKYSGLLNPADQKRMLDRLVKDDVLDHEMETREVNGAKKVVELFKPAKELPGLPGGMDVRAETFKQGETPAAYEIKAGAELIDTVDNEEDAAKNLETHIKNRQAKVAALGKQIATLESHIAGRDAELTQMKSLGQSNTDDFFHKEANFFGQDSHDREKIKSLREEQQTFAAPVRMTPVGTKPITSEGFTYYENGKSVARFDTQEKADQFGISRLDDATLQRIIDAAPHQKQTGTVKRYSDLAQKELNERQSIETDRGIAVGTNKGLKGAKERLESLGIYSKEAKDNLENLRQSLLPALKRFGLENVGLRIVKSIEDGKADGMYVQQIMTIALDSKNPMGTLRHESIHALKELGAFTTQEWKVLENKAKSEWVQKYIKDANLYDSYKEQYQAERGNLIGFEPYIQEEAIAEAFKHFKVGNLPPGMIGNIWARLNKMFEALRNSFNKLGFQTTEDIFTKVEEGGIKTLEVKPTEAEVKLAKRPLNTKEDIISDGIKRYADAMIRNRVEYDATPSAMTGRAYAALIKIEDGITERLKNVGVSSTRDSSGKIETDEILYKQVFPKASEIVRNEQKKAEEKLALRETEQFSKDAVETNNWKATPIAKQMAEDYAKENGITPYVSEGQISVPVEPVKYSIKPPSEDSSKNDPVTGLPLNKNGSVTLYYPTTAEEARRINNEKKLVALNPNMSAIYLTNESSGWKSLGRMSDEYQQTDGSVVRVEIDPNLLQMAEEYEDGRKEFYVPVKEGEYFNKKMRLWAMYAERSKPIALATKYSDLGNAFDRSLNAFKQLSEAQKRTRMKEVKDLLKREHNIGKLLGENGKLEKTRVGDYGITYDDKSVASLGLGLASAQKLNDKTSTCPVSAICEGLCLGDTSGNNMMYGGMASGELAKSLEKTSFRAGPRLSQYLKTEAMMVHPDEFVLLLDKEIKAFKRWADKNEYLPAIRLNVTSDIPPKYLKPIMDANPEVIFYDYTKLDSSTVADNHHLTYSSTGVSQVVNGEQVVNKEQNWDRMKRLLDKGSNVAMAFTSKSDMPSVVVDEVSGKEYQVWNGDNYDARFLDPKRDDGVGMIVGLTNKAATLKAPTAAKETNGFFIDYEKTRDGDRVVIPDQSKFAGNKVIPITKIAGESTTTQITPTPEGKYSLRSQIDPTIQSRIGATTTVRKEAGFVDRIVDAISPTAMTKLRQAFINKYDSIEKLSHIRGEKMGGDQLLAENSAIAAALQSDRAAGVAASSFRDGVPIFDKGYTYVSNMDNKVKGLIPVLEPLMKYNDPYVFQAFQYYAGTRRGRRLDAEGREKTFTKEDFEAGNKLEQQFPEFATVFDEYQKYNSGLVKYMMDTGVISAEEAKIWTQNWDYIPFYRQIDGEKTAGPKVFSPIAGVAKPKKLKGSEAELDDFMETIVRNARAAIEAGMKNEAARRVIRDVVDFGLGEKVKDGTSGSDIVTVKENGNTVYYRVADPLLVESLKGLNLPQLPFMDILSAPANLLRNFVTKDPGFILANLGRDSMQAWITSGTNMTPLVDSFKQFGKELLNQSPEAYALAKSGLTGYDFAGDVASTAKQVEKELRKRSGTRTAREQALLPITAFWDMLEKGSHASDMATRAEVYKRTLERTGSEAEAFYQAMEVMNFSRKGNSALIRILSAMIPFLNARVQGLDVLYRTGFGKAAMENKEKIQKAFIFRSMVLLGTSAMYWAMVSDDDDYKKLSKEERDNYWIIPAIRVGDKPFRFPIPFELGVLFKVLPERALEYSFGTDTGKDLRESLLRNAMSTLSFNPIPQAALPLVENATNHSFFTGEPIIGRGVEGLAPQYQFTGSTSELAKKMGKELNYSPVKIENLIRGYTGTLGTYAMMMIDAAFTGEGDTVKASKRVEQLPVIKRFFSGDSGTISAYYDLKEEVNTVVATVNMLQRTGNANDLKEYLADNQKLYGLKGYIGVLDKSMTKLSQASKLIQTSPTMTADEKREALDKIHEAQLKLTERVRILRKDFE